MLALWNMSAVVAFALATLAGALDSWIPIYLITIPAVTGAFALHRF